MLIVICFLNLVVLLSFSLKMLLCIYLNKFLVYRESLKLLQAVKLSKLPETYLAMKRRDCSFHTFIYYP